MSTVYNRSNAVFKVKAWLEQAERDSFKRNHPIDDPLPIEIVVDAVDLIEQKLEQLKKIKPKPFNILRQPDDKYDFSSNRKPAPKPGPSKPKKSKNRQSVITPNKRDTKGKRSGGPAAPQKSKSKEPSVLDAYDDLKNIFELDDYLHEEDSDGRPMVYKSQPIKLSDAKSRLKPPAKGPYILKKPFDWVEAKVDCTRKPILDPVEWKNMPKRLTNTLYQGKMAVNPKDVSKSFANIFNPTVFIERKLLPEASKSSDCTKVTRAPWNANVVIEPKKNMEDLKLPLMMYLEKINNSHPIAIPKDLSEAERDFEIMRNKILKTDRLKQTKSSKSPMEKHYMEPKLKKDSSFRQERIAERTKQLNENSKMKSKSKDTKNTQSKGLGPATRNVAFKQHASTSGQQNSSLGPQPKPNSMVSRGLDFKKGNLSKSMLNSKIPNLTFEIPYELKKLLSTPPIDQKHTAPGLASSSMHSRPGTSGLALTREFGSHRRGIQSNQKSVGGNGNQQKATENWKNGRTVLPKLISKHTQLVERGEKLERGLSTLFKVVFPKKI